jgi:hypothetical protein
VGVDGAVAVGVFYLGLASVHDSHERKFFNEKGKDVSTRSCSQSIVV